MVLLGAASRLQQDGCALVSLLTGSEQAIALRNVNLIGLFRPVSRRGDKALPANEPRPLPGEPEMPSYLDSGARAEWKRIVPILTTNEG